MIRKTLIFILITLILTTFMIYGYPDIGYSNVSDIGIYKNNTYDSNIVDVLDSNSMVSIVGENDIWYKIKTNKDYFGWIEKNYINTPPERYIINNCGSKVNLRLSPTTSSKIVGQVLPNEELKYIETFHSWYIVEFKGQQVYMASWLGEISSNGNDNIYLVDDTVNIRNKPTIQGSVIYQGNRYDSFEYYGELNGWIKIKLPSGDFGYVAGWLTSYNNNFYIDGIKKYKKTSDNLRLRVGPSLEDKIITVIKENTRVRVLETIGDWDKVITSSGQIGYSFNKYLFEYKPLMGKTILLNPGHGGRDPGASGYNKLEKDINLEVSLSLEKLLITLGANVIMTRTSDTYMSRNDRANMSNKLSPDIMFSIHHNALNNNDYFGTSTYYDTKNNASGNLSKILARSIYNNVVQINNIYKDGVYDRNFEVLRKTNIPAALIEIGFMSNKWESQNMHLESFQNEVINKIALGIVDYFNKIK